MDKATERLERLEFATRKADALLNGREVPDDVPLAATLKLPKQESLSDMIQRLVRTNISALAASEGYETFEEANDFDIGDDPELKGEYEIDDELPLGISDYPEPGDTPAESAQDTAGDTPPSDETPPAE